MLWVLIWGLVYEGACYGKLFFCLEFSGGGVDLNLHGGAYLKRVIFSGRHPRGFKSLIQAPLHRLNITEKKRRQTSQARRNASVPVSIFPAV